MKEAFVAVLAGFQSLGHDDAHERPVDRLMAIMNAGQRSHLASIGKDLIAFKFSHRAEYREPAILGLAEALGWSNLKVRLKPWQRSPVAAWAIREWTIDICPTCSGKTHVPNHDVEKLEGVQPMKVCQTCRGTGKRRWSDQEREEGMGDLRIFERPLYVAHGLIGQAEREAVHTGRFLVQDWGQTASTEEAKVILHKSRATP